MFDPPRFFGLVLNISLRPGTAKAIREELVRFVNKFEDEDLFYFNEDTVDVNGKRVALIGNWQPQEVASCLGTDLLRALLAVSGQGDMDGNWYLCLIADRYKINDENQLTKMLDMNRFVWGKANVMVITIGDHYDFKEYQKVCDDYVCVYDHISSPVGICSLLSEWIGLEK